MGAESQPTVGKLVVELVDAGFERRYALAEQAETYRLAFGPDEAHHDTGRDEARRAILRRVLSTHGPLGRDWLLAR